MKIRRLLGLLMLAACSRSDAPAVDTPRLSPGPVWTAATRWRLEDNPEITIRGRVGERLEVAPLDPTGVVRLSDGRYVVGDGDQAGWDAFLIYDSAGNYLGKWGREGKGPGEFGQLFFGPTLLRGDTIAGYDPTDQSYELFSPEGKFIVQISRRLALTMTGRGKQRRTTVGSSRGLFADGGQLWTRYDVPAGMMGGKTPRSMQNREVTLDAAVLASGRDGDTIALTHLRLTQWRARDGDGTGNWRPFAPWMLFEVGNNRWYLGDGKTFVVRVFDRSGNELPALARDVAPEKLTAEEKEGFIMARIEEAKFGTPDGAPRSAMPDLAEKFYRETTTYPEFKAVYSAIVEDEKENVWVEHFRWPLPEAAPTPTATTWSVFDRDGRLLGEVIMPPSFFVSTITNDRVLGFYQDDNDVKHVRIYRIIKP